MSQEYIMRKEKNLLSCGLRSVAKRVQEMMSVRNYALSCENTMLNRSEEVLFISAFQYENIGRQYMALVRRRIVNSILWDMNIKRIIIYPPLFLPILFENKIIRYNTFIIMIFKEGLAIPILTDPTNRPDSERLTETIKLYEDDIVIV